MSNVYKFPNAKERQAQQEGNLSDPELQEQLRAVLNQLDLEQELITDLEFAVSNLLESANNLVFEPPSDPDTEELLRTAIMIVNKLSKVLNH